MFGVSSPALRVAVLALLVLGTLLRPMLLLTCEIHAAAFAHASQPHVHEHADAEDASGPDGDHGDHESLHLGTLGAAADVAPVVFVAVFYPAPKAWSQARVAFDAHYALAPFRPPIA